MLRTVVSVLFLAVSVALVGAESVPEYVVTASRESREAMDEPARVSVITADDIERTIREDMAERRRCDQMLIDGQRLMATLAECERQADSDI